VGLPIVDRGLSACKLRMLGIAIFKDIASTRRDDRVAVDSSTVEAEKGEG